MNRLTVLNAYHFTAGEDVPNFLLDYVPHSPKSKAPDKFVFLASCDVFETADRFVVSPTTSGSGAMITMDGVNLSFNAVSKDVYLAYKAEVICTG